MREKEPVQVEFSSACRGQGEEPYCGPSCDSRTPVLAFHASLASNWQAGEGVRQGGADGTTVGPGRESRGYVHSSGRGEMRAICPLLLKTLDHAVGVCPWKGIALRELGLAWGASELVFPVGHSSTIMLCTAQPGQ